MSLELIPIERDLWLYVLILVIPATAVGVMTGAAILHVAAARRSKANNEGNSSTKLR